MTTPVAEVRNLRKTYGQTVAVDDVSFVVEHGEIFGILGPDGAGKTTAVECLVGLHDAHDGSVRVLGVDPLVDPEHVRDVLGVQSPELPLHDRTTVREALELFAAFHESPLDVEVLLRLLDLGPLRDTASGQLSSDERRRLSIALALVGDPRVVVLDEPTRGLDPASRAAVWDLVDRVRATGVTILLVTHCAEEAARLCDRLLMLDDGRVAGITARTRAAQPTPRSGAPMSPVAGTPSARP